MFGGFDRKVDENKLHFYQCYLLPNLEFQSKLPEVWAAIEHSLKTGLELDASIADVQTAKIERLERLKPFHREHLVKLHLLSAFKLQLQLCPQTWLLPQIPPTLANQQSMLEIGEGQELENDGKQLGRNP